MKPTATKKCLSIVVSLLLLCSSAAMAEISFNGSVVNSVTYEVYAPIGGTVESVPVKAGQSVTADDVLLTLKTAKVYASEDGTVTGIFGQPGDATENVSARYGAVLYVEGNELYSVSASTENAYNSTDTKIVHVGESVYMVGRSDSSHKGIGVISSIEGISYTVSVQSGTFLLDESVDVYRGEKAVNGNRIGRGTVSRKNPAAYAGTGSIVSIAVTDGQRVSRGDLLFETLEGSFDGFYMSGTSVFAGVEGTIASINATQGGILQKDSVVCVIYPKGEMMVEAELDETDLSYVKIGDPVTVELEWNQDNEVSYPGIVTDISAVASAQGSESTGTTYTVRVKFTPDQDTRYGMSAVVTTQDAVQTPSEEKVEMEEE